MLGRARAHAPRPQGIVSAPGYNEVVVQLESRPRDRRAGLRGSSRGAPGRRLTAAPRLLADRAVAESRSLAALPCRSPIMRACVTD